MRLAYALAWVVAAPIAFLRLLWKARRHRGYLRGIGERFGFYPEVEAVDRLWIHAVSVGETRAAEPLVTALRRRFPRHRILLTHMTPTGWETGVALFGDTVERAWLPYDFGFAVRRFLARYRPSLGVLLETEIWPRLIAQSRAAGIPVVLANARLSERSARGYARIAGLARWALANLTQVAAQTDADRRRFAALGATRPCVTGNVKFDLAIPEPVEALAAELGRLFGAGRSVWVAGSTRDGEEALLLEAFAAAPVPAEVLLVLVPRHPDRFEPVRALAAERGFTVARRSDGARVPAEARVVLGDSMGEMLAYYAAADLALMGGSFLAFGSQNLIEPCAVGTPVIIGPSTYNFAEAARGAIEAGAALAARDAGDAVSLALALMRDRPRLEAMGQCARDFVSAHRGATERTVRALEEALGPASAPARD